MYLTYHPDGSDTPQQWTVQLGKLQTFDTEAIEKVTGMAYGGEFKERLFAGHSLARRAFLWVLLRREHPTLKFANVSFADDELKLEQDRDELAETRKSIAESDELAETRKAALLAAIDREMATAPEPPGKAPASSGGSNTPSQSLPSSPE